MSKKQSGGLKICSNCENWIPQNAQYCPFCDKAFNEPEKKSSEKNDKNRILLFIAGVITTILLALILRWISVHTFVQHTGTGSTAAADTNKGGQDSNTGVSSTSTIELRAVVEPEAALREIDNAMSKCIYIKLLTQADEGNLNSSVDIELTDAEKIRAAVLASELDGRLDSNFRIENGRLMRDAHVETGPNGYGYHGMSVSEEDVEQNCRNMFGTKAKWEELQTEGKCHLYDAVRYADFSNTYALIVDTEVDTELAQESHDYIVVENGNGYRGGL